MDRYLSHQLRAETSAAKRKQLGRETLLKDVRFCRTDKGKVVAVSRRSAQRKAPLHSVGRTIYNLNTNASLAAQPNDTLHISEDEFSAFLDEMKAAGEWILHAEGGIILGPEGESVCISQRYGLQEGACWTDETKCIDVAGSYSNATSGRSTPELCWSTSASSLASFNGVEQVDMSLDAVFHEFIDIEQCEQL